MIAVVAGMSLKEGKEKEFLAQAEKVVAATRKEDGCVGYVCCKNPDDPLGIVIVEKWESKDALDAHMQTAHFKDFIAGTEALTVGPADIKVYPVLI